MLISVNGRVFILKFPFFCCQQMTVLSGFAYTDEQWTAESIFFGIVEVVDSCYNNHDAISSGFHLKCFLDNISDQKCSCSPIYLNKDQKYSSTLTDLLRELLSIGFLLASWFILIRCRIHDPVLLCHNSEAYFCMHVLNKGEKSCILL